MITPKYKEWQFQNYKNKVFFIIILVSLISSTIMVAFADETRTITMNGVHTIDGFPETYFDDTLGVTMYRIDSSLQTIIREEVTLSHTEIGYMLENPNNINISEYFPTDVTLFYTDPLTDIEQSYVIPAQNYFWTDLQVTEITVCHWGTHHLPDKSKMGWLSNNQLVYYPNEQSQYKFSSTPEVPQDLELYIPNDGYPITDYTITEIDWCSLLQDAQIEPYFSRLVKMYGNDEGIYFISDTDHANQYRKAVVITYTATAQIGYPSVEYSTDIPLYDTVVTYTDTP